jgi:hypothetical protein
MVPDSSNSPPGHDIAPPPSQMERPISNTRPEAPKVPRILMAARGPRACSASHPHPVVFDQALVLASAKPRGHPSQLLTPIRKTHRRGERSRCPRPAPSCDPLRPNRPLYQVVTTCSAADGYVRVTVQGNLATPFRSASCAIRPTPFNNRPAAPAIGAFPVGPDRGPRC